MTTNCSPIRAPADDPTITKKFVHLASSVMQSSQMVIHTPGVVPQPGRGPALAHLRRKHFAAGLHAFENTSFCNHDGAQRVPPSRVLRIQIPQVIGPASLSVIGWPASLRVSFIWP